MAERHDGAQPRRVPAARLAEVVRASGRSAVIVGSPELAVSGITHDSRRVHPGDAFCCVRGMSHDGHDFADAALVQGARILVVDHELTLGPAAHDVGQLVVEDVRAAMPFLAAEVYGNPDRLLDLIAVTGTNGKTTVVELCGQILRTLGRRAETIGTLSGPRTTPESTDLDETLSRFASEGVEAVAMEVSSHALALGRVDGLRFDVAVFTNLGKDHLDFHGTPERYFETKARLFDPERCEVAVLNVDDVHGRLLRDTARVPVREVSLGTVGPISLQRWSSRLEWRGHQVELPLVGRFNVTDALLAAEAVCVLGADPSEVAEALGEVTPPAGRMERVDAGQDFIVIVDFAHTPDALEEVMATLREVGSGRLIVVFGCGGDRDRSKRPLMGEVACRLADMVVITSDNPRSESPWTIMSSVRSGCSGHEPRMIEDRREAIDLALGAASPGDVVLIAGKGHEGTQTIGDRTEPFDDRVVVADLLAARRAGSPPTEGGRGATGS